MGNENKKGNFIGLLPLIIFVALYIVSTIITGNAGTMPLNVGILIAIIFAFIFCNKKRKAEGLKFDDMVTSFCKGGGDDTLILMFFIFLEAGIFYCVAGGMGAVGSVSNLGLKLLPSSMRKDALFVNAARSALVDYGALRRVLEEEKIRGAILDVLNSEPPTPEDLPITKCPNVLLTPHICGATYEVTDHQSDILTDSIRRWLAKEDLEKIVYNRDVLKR